MHILSEYYPETLHTSHFLGMHWIVRAFVNLVWPFVDAKTKQKVNFETDIVGAGDVEPGELLRECGGELDVSDIGRA